MTNYDSASGYFEIMEPQNAFVSAFDRSFLFGDSIYEVVRTYNGVLFSTDEHLRRLERSAKLGYFSDIPDLSLLRTMIHQTCKAYFQKFGNHDVYVRLILSRGLSDLNIDTDLSSSSKTLLYVKQLKALPEEKYTKGVHVSIVDRRRNHPDALDPAMKSGIYLNNVLALYEAKKNGAEDAVLLSQQGFVTELTTSNIFIVSKGEVITAPLSVGILAGITRDWIFRACEESKIPYSERLYTAEDLRQADEVFLSSSLKEIVPITKVDHQKIGNGTCGAVTAKLGKALKKVIQSQLDLHKKESLFV